MFQAQTCGIFESLLHLGRTLLQHNEITGQTMPAAAHKGSFHGLMGSRGVLKQSSQKSRFTLLGGKKAICRGSGPDWRAGAGARVWSPLPLVPSKGPSER